MKIRPIFHLRKCTVLFNTNGCYTCALTITLQVLWPSDLPFMQDNTDFTAWILSEHFM